MSLTVRVIAPVGRDAELIVRVLREHGIEAEPFADPVSALEARGGEPVGPLLIAEEALTTPVVEQLTELVHHQPAWSDFPIVILTTGGRETLQSRRLEQERVGLGSPVLLERPIRTETLIGSLRAAVRARRRQYEVRDALVERDFAFAELSAERETLRVMLDNVPVGLVLANAHGEVVQANAAMEHILRHPVIRTSEIGEHERWGALHEDGRPFLSKEYPLVQAITEDKTVTGEQLLYRRGDNTTAWVSLSAAPIHDLGGAVAGGVVAILDIDAEKRAADAQRTLEDRFRKLIENASVGILIGDTGGGISFMNPHLLHLLGYTEEEVREDMVRWESLTPPEYAEADRHAVGQLERTGRAEPYQKAYRAKDGRLIPFLIGAAVIPSPVTKDGHGEVAVFVTDLSSQKKAEAALVQNEKLAAVGRLAASISHEINNPLEAVTNLLYLIKQEDGLTQDGRTYLGLAERELARVSQIAAQTLRFHRQATNARPVTPEELIESVVGLYQGRLSNSHIELVFEHRGSDPVTCYEGDIRQVLNNLVGNAIDSMRNGGRLILRTRNATRWSDGAAGVRITIADTGYGMSRETLGRIFEAFFTTKGINGTGLGLWISRGIVDKHHGRMDVWSSDRKPHTGTVFSLFLPRGVEPEGGPMEPAVRLAPGTVDDFGRVLP